MSLFHVHSKAQHHHILITTLPEKHHN